MLIPGAGGDAWYWHRLVAELAERGRRAIAVELPADDPTAGLDRYEDIANAAAQALSDVVVVGQTMGGFTAPLLCDRLPVRQLILINAMIPLPHETVGEWWANTGHRMPDDFDPAVHFFHDVPDEISRVGIVAGKEQSDRPSPTRGHYTNGRP